MKNSFYSLASMFFCSMPVVVLEQLFLRDLAGNDFSFASCTAATATVALYTFAAALLWRPFSSIKTFPWSHLLAVSHPGI